MQEEIGRFDAHLDKIHSTRPDRQFPEAWLKKRGLINRGDEEKAKEGQQHEVNHTLPITAKKNQAPKVPCTFGEVFDASKHIDRTKGTPLALARMATEYELNQVAADAMATEALLNNAARRYDLTVKKWQILTKLHVEEKIKEAKEEDEKLKKMEGFGFMQAGRK